MSKAFDFVASVYSGGLASKADKEGISSLDLEQKHVLLAWWAKGEIDNGGFELLYNLPINIDDVVQSFYAIGANGYAKACEESKDLFPYGKPPAELSERSKLVKQVMDSKTEDPWLPLNRIVWEGSEKFDDLLSVYIKKNIEHFTTWILS